METLFVVDVNAVQKTCYTRYNRDRFRVSLSYAMSLHALRMFKANRQLRGPERLCQSPPRNAKRARLTAFDQIRNSFSLAYAQMIA